MHVSTKDLALINQLHAKQFDVKIFQASEGFGCAIVLPDLEQDTERKLITFRGEEKRWRKLQDALAFVRQHCPDSRRLTVTAEGYMLSTPPP